MSDGNFSLDPGAYFGIVPRPLWGKRFSLDARGRVILSLNVLLVRGERYNALVDSGIGHMANEKLSNIFEVKENQRFVKDIEKYVKPDKVDYILQSHLHFDHSGNSFVKNQDGEFLFKNAKIVVQKKELNAFRKPDEFTKGNYMSGNSKIPASRIISVEGSKRINSDLRVILTGGHSQGHQVIVIGSPGNEFIYFGDLIPSAFHIKLPYVTAIDIEPLETVRMKKLLIRKAIRDHAICIFNHDGEIPAGYISGDPENPKLESVTLQ
ncbi:MAG: MBL fold metallo-hydrolase [Thermoplasmatales archaeon]|nr:MBL fold metallo-hydrolase [Thermoplasmatales archaeon]MCW6170221.1 MBL fold metallo-hydrolase [Thermoplasmatales archaeon]